MLKNACTMKDNDFVISIIRRMQSEQIEPTEESFQMVETYHKTLFRSLRTEASSKRMRNECFKVSREYKQWRKHFRADQPKEWTNKESAINKVMAPKPNRKTHHKQNQLSNRF